MHRTSPIHPAERFALLVRNRDDIDVLKLLEKRNQIRNIEPSMEGGQRRYRISSRQGEVEIVNVKVNKVKIIGLAVDQCLAFEHDA